MAFAQNEAVAPGPEGILRIIAHDALPLSGSRIKDFSEIQYRQDIGHRKGPSRVTHSGLGDIFHGGFSNSGCQQLQPLDFPDGIQVFALRHTHVTFLSTLGPASFHRPGVP